MTDYSKTQSSILDVAQELTQTRGFNGFSYRDVADRIGIRTASIHHHFRTKGDLGVAMTERYRQAFMDAARRLESTTPDPIELLRQYALLFRATLESGRMCLCGTLAVELETLPPSMKTEVQLFFKDNERWLEGLFTRAQAEGAFPASTPPHELAIGMLSLLEGAMMSARAFGESRRFLTTIDQFLARLTPSP